MNPMLPGRVFTWNYQLSVYHILLAAFKASYTKYATQLKDMIEVHFMGDAQISKREHPTRLQLPCFISTLGAAASNLFFCSLSTEVQLLLGGRLNA